MNDWLVGFSQNPSEKSWNDRQLGWNEIPNMMGKIIQMFQTTNQAYIVWMNHRISLTWTKAIVEWFPLLTIVVLEVAVRSL